MISLPHPTLRPTNTDPSFLASATPSVITTTVSAYRRIGRDRYDWYRRRLPIEIEHYVLRLGGSRGRGVTRGRYRLCIIESLTHPSTKASGSFLAGQVDLPGIDAYPALRPKPGGRIGFQYVVGFDAYAKQQR